MSCPPGGCASWGASRLCKPLPPVCLGCDYDPGELQMLWFCWRARSTGEYGGLIPVDLAPGLIDISGKTNIAKIIEYCQQRGTLVAPFTAFNRFGFSGSVATSNSFGSAIGGGFGSGAFGSGGFSGGGEGTKGRSPDIIIAPAAGGSAGGGGGGAGTCGCTPDDPNLLTVVVCTELDCQAESPKIELTVCGGTPPYSWSITGHEGTITFTQSGTNNRNVKAVPPDPVNVLGVAYHKVVYSFGPPNCDVTENARMGYDCEDVPDNLCNQANICDTETGTPFCQDISCAPTHNDVCDVSVGSICGSAGACNGCDKVLAREGLVCDVRSQTQIDDGCLPCGLVFKDAIITVTDGVGTQVSTVINP